jgi:predicted dehydrogenase
MSKVNVALIGYSFMGKAHSNAYRQVKAFLDPPVEPELKVICGRNEENVKTAADRYGWQEYETDWRKVVRRKDIDVIDIVTPGDSHKEIAVAAAKSGKAILCEKPLANSLSEAEEMLNAVEAAGVLHMICHNYRKVPAIMLARRIIEDGRLGEIYHYRGTYLQDWIVDPDFPLVWRLRKEKAGSGALGDILSHSLDLARYLVGEIDEVASVLKTFIKERPLPDDRTRKGSVTVDDAVATLVRFASGAIGTIEGSRFCPGRRNYNRFEINGSKGSLAFNLERLNELEVYFQTDEPDVQGFRTVNATDADHPYMNAWWPPGHIIGYEHSFTHIIYELMQAIHTGENPKPNFHDGFRNQQVLDAIQRAGESKRWERVQKDRQFVCS